MSADQIVLTADRTFALGQSVVAPGTPRQPAFWLALACAAAVHAALVFGISRSSLRYLGDPAGSPDAIDVELVDESELGARARAASSAANPPAPPASAAQPASPAAEPAPPDATRAPEAAPPPQSAAVPALEAEKPQAPPDAAAKPSPPEADVTKAEAKKAEAKKQSATEPAPKQELKPPARLDLSVPFDLTMQGAAGGGGSSSATRPASITRSGENDRFGHDVIRALKKTMPPSNGAKGRVTIRIFLNERGNIAQVRLVQSGGNRDLDQDVVFAAHQTSFPFPPKGATLADRTFLVTYVYR